MEDEIKSVEGTKTYRALSRVKNRYGGAPGEEDLHGAARALNRLQAVYRLHTLISILIQKLIWCINCILKFPYYGETIIEAQYYFQVQRN